MKSKPSKVACITLGCPKNQTDSEVLAGELRRAGAILVADPTEADTVFINTCGFVRDAKKESIDAILRTIGLKQDDPGKKVVVWGCLSQRHGEELKQEIPEVDRFFGVEPFAEMGQWFLGPQYRFRDSAYRHRILSTPPHTAYLKIADGCDHLCTFCSIPLIKGKYRSRSLLSLEAEARSLVRQGVREIVLVAQDTTAWGKDRNPGVGLDVLLSRLTALEGLDWIRILYGHPSHLEPSVVRMMAQESKICRYLDIPLQHSSSPMLQAMGRPGSGPQLRDWIGGLRNAIPGLVLRTTLMVGFPGETDRDFQELIDFVEEIRFERLGVFVYCPEPGTASWDLKPRIPVRKARERRKTLMGIQQGISLKKNRECVGKTLPVLIDGFDPKKKRLFGRTEGDCLDIDQIVWVQGEAVIGRIVPVRIESGGPYDLIGVAVPANSG